MICLFFIFVYPSSLTCICSKRFSKLFAMEGSKVNQVKDLPLGLDPTTEDEYNSQSKLLQEFTNISSIDKAWTFKSGGSGMNA